RIMENFIGIKNNKKQQRKILYYFSLMFVLVLFGAIIWAMLELKVDTESSVFTNCVLSLVGLLFSAILFMSCITGNFGWKIKKNFYLVWILLCISTEFFCLGAAFTMEGKPEFGIHIEKFSYIYYLLFVVLTIMFLLYLLEFFPNKERYKKFTIFYLILSFLYVILLVVNYFTGILFKVENGVLILFENDIVSSCYDAFCNILFFFLIVTSKLKKTYKRAFLSYSLFPLVVMIVNIIITFAFEIVVTINLQVLSQLVPIYIIFVTLYLEDRNELEKQKADNTEMKTAIMISQIQPHFVYNTLATISGLCREEGAMKTREVVNKFANYLRVNIDSLSLHQLVPFEKELEHVKTYLYIEKLRFGDDIKAEYDIGVSDFEMPTLTIQPLVENAVKHGICKKEGGGTVKIITKRDGDYIIIQVVDDGVGYDVNQELNDGRTHIGISNIQSRLEILNKGTLEIESEIGKGTVATLRIFYNVGGGYTK
ncbi:MAG: histidine kinase, partial [Firmicutes bacterium]|nr:histidine kinase [Candidatus Caballimonas caccae]